MFTVISRRLRDDSAGFSLVELLVVIILLSILGGVVTTSLIVSMRDTRQDQNRNVSSEQSVPWNVSTRPS